MALQTIVNANVVIAGAAPAPAPLDIEILGATLTGPQATAWTAEYGANLIVPVASDTWRDVLAAVGIANGAAVYEYLELTFGQSRFPRLVQLGRRATPIAQQTDFLLNGGAGSAADGLYRITLNGVNFDVNAVAQTRAQVVTALQGLIDAAPDYSAAIGGTPETVDVTAAEAGAGFSFAASAPVGESWTITPTQANVGLTSDVVLWEAERKTRSLDAFYEVTIPEAVTEALARNVDEFAASFERDIHFTLRTDSATDPNALNGTGTAQTLAPTARGRLMLTYVPTATDYDWAAVLARRLSVTPGTASWGNLTLSGVDGELYSSTDDNVLIPAPYLYFDRIESFGLDIGISRNAYNLDGTRMDVLRGADYLKARVLASVFGLLLRVAAEDSKIPFTTAGYAQIGAAIESALVASVLEGFIPSTREDGTPGYSVTIPPVPEPLNADRIAGIARGFSFTAIVAGSVERVIDIDGLLIQ